VEVLCVSAVRIGEDPWIRRTKLAVREFGARIVSSDSSGGGARPPELRDGEEFATD
jgi:hypothetical protein